MMNVQPFQWDGRELRTREDWREALMSVLTRADAAAFMAQIYGWFPGGRGEAADFVGYMTGEVPRPLGVKVRRLLGVRHPLNPDDVETTPREDLLAGIGFAQRKVQPMWLRLALSYGRPGEGASFRPAEWKRAVELAKIAEDA